LCQERISEVENEFNHLKDWRGWDLNPQLESLISWDPCNRIGRSCK
jgi:hypothetical protein